MQSLEDLPANDQAAVNTVWSLFSSSPARRRLLILRGLLTIACPSQLTFLQEALTAEMRLDPLEVLPREVSLKVFSYLDAISLGRAAQVSHSWKETADDDLLWRTMCEQHIERKCEKCGWGLPLLGERRRKARGAINALPQRLAQNEQDDTAAQSAIDSTENATSPGPSSVASELAIALQAHAQHAATHNHPTHSPNMLTSGSTTPMHVDDSTDSHRNKRSKTQSPRPSRCNSPHPMSPRAPSRKPSAAPAPSTRPWKMVYCERLAIERNWRRGTAVSTILKGHTDAITCLQVAEDLPHPSFPVLMTGSWDRSVRIWNLETGKAVGVLRGHTRGVRALQFDALKLVTGSMDSTLKIWNWRTGECMRTLRGHSDAVICLTYDKQLLVSGSADSTIRVWDFGTGEVYTLRGHAEWVNSVALWDSKEACATGSAQARDALVSDVSGAGGVPASNPAAAKASSKGKFLFSASDDLTIRVWDLYTRQCVRVLRGHVAQVQSLRVIPRDLEPSPAFPAQPISPSATRVASDTEDDQRGRPGATRPAPSLTTLPPAAAAAFLNPTATPLAPMEFATDQRPQVVSSSHDNTIKVWDVESGECEKTMFGHIEGVWDVDVDKLRIVSASHDRTLKIWDKESGRCLHTLVGHTSALTAVVLQDQYVVTGSDDASVRIWNFSPATA